MSKRVSNKRGSHKGNGRLRVRPARGGGHQKTSKWEARKPLIFDPVAAIDKLMRGG